MEEMGENAKIFKAYSDENERVDNELVNGWLNMLDTLLIFVSILYSYLPSY